MYIGLYLFSPILNNAYNIQGLGYLKIYEELCYHSHKENAQTTKSLLLNQLFCLIISDV